MAFAKLKAHLRAKAIRTIDALWQAIGDIRRPSNYAKIVRYKEETDIELGTKSSEQIENLCLDRHVEGGSRLIGYRPARLVAGLLTSTREKQIHDNPKPQQFAQIAECPSSPIRCRGPRTPDYGSRCHNT